MGVGSRSTERAPLAGTSISHPEDQRSGPPRSLANHTSRATMKAPRAAQVLARANTSDRQGILSVAVSNVTKVGCLSSTFGNSAPKTKILVSRLDRGVYEVSRRPQDTAPKDDRGPVVRTVETAQTFLTASEVDALVGDYLAGMSVKALAERYGIHRATVFAHLRRRNVPSRRPGLGIDEKAEAVRLARAGVSMRAIGRRMGVDRKAVRAALVEAGLIADESASSS